MTWHTYLKITQLKKNYPNPNKKKKPTQIKIKPPHPNQMHFVDVSDHSCRVSAEDYGVTGLRYGSGNLSFGATVMPFSYT
jgi:hypothetical protein